MAEYAMEQTSRRKQKEPTNSAKSGRHEPIWQVENRRSEVLTSLIDTDARPVAKLALKVLSVLISSALIERILSQAGLATASHRNRTDFDLLNSQLFIFCNRHI
uniref:Uncharacterized protein n=1 Tax=Ditylenchus dipsaci TaxID=166011 RepID=A0A915E6J3_9BILA